MSEAAEMRCPQHRGPKKALGTLQLIWQRAHGNGYLRSVDRRYKCVACGWVFDTSETVIHGFRDKPGKAQA